MMFICGNLLAADRLEVGTKHYMPELLTPEKIALGYLVESIPVAETILGKEAILYFNPQTGDLWYEYTDRPLTDSEEIQALKQENIELVQQINDLNLAIAAIIGGAA